MNMMLKVDDSRTKRIDPSRERECERDFVASQRLFLPDVGLRQWEWDISRVNFLCAQLNIQGSEERLLGAGKNRHESSWNSHSSLKVR